MTSETMSIPAGGGVLLADGQIRPFTAAERRHRARRQAAEAAAKAAANAWFEALCPSVFRGLPNLPDYRTVHRWLMKFRPDDPDRRRFETVLRQYLAVHAELSVRYWRVGRRRRDAVLRAIRQWEMDDVEDGGTR
jgi:hypothetical protein